jgi:tetratricopeptide (TPR) repeat protein
MSDIKQMYDEAWEQYFIGRHDDSIALLKKIIDIDSNQPTALSFIAVNYCVLNNYEEAQKYIDRALAINPDNSLAYTARGMSLDFQGKHSDARQDHDQAIRISPDSWFSRARSARNFYQLERTKDALTELDLILASKPDCFYAYYQKGAIYQEQNKQDEAIQAFSRAIELKKNYVSAYNARGELFSDKQKIFEAFSDFNKVLEINPDDKDSLFRYAWCLDQLNRVDESIGAYTRFIEKYKDEPWSNAFQNRGWGHIRKENFKAAIDDFDSALKIDSKNIYAQTNRGYAKLQQKDLNGAVEDLKAALLLDPKWTSALDYLITAYEEKGDFARALAAKAHLRQISPRPHWTYKDPETQLFTETVYNHFNNLILPALQKNNERFVDYWEVRMMWGAKQSQTIYQGTSGIVHEGKFGAGYLLFAEKNIWIVNIGELSKRFIKTTGLVGKFFLAALRNLDMRSAEKNDKVFCIPHSDIQYVNSKDGAIVIGIGGDNWEIAPWFSDVDNSLLAALNLARRDMVSDIWAPLVTPPTPKPTTETSSDEIYSQIEKLKKLLDIHAISQEQYDTKVQDLLSRL